METFNDRWRDKEDVVHKHSGVLATKRPASWGICMRVRKQKLELDMEQQTGSKQEKEYVKALYCHPAYWT